MIKQLQLINFQSHKATDLDLDKGINAIIGPSDNGKSAVLRALYWAVYNQPSGDAFLSHWARNEKGNQRDPVAVTVVRADGQTITREKSMTFNGYRLENKDDLGAIGRGNVPEEIQKFFNLSEVNIQRQLDSPFLLGDSPNEVARFFNGLVNLSVIDKYMSAMESRKRQLNSDIRAAESALEKDRAALEELNWVEQAEKILTRLEKISNRIDGKNKQLAGLQGSLVRYDIARKSIDRAGNIKQMEKLSKSYSTTQNQIREKQLLLNNLERTTRNYLRAQRIVKRNDDLSVIEESLEAYSEIQNHIAEKKRKLRQLSLSLDGFHNAEELVSNLSYLDEAESLLKKVKKISSRIKDREKILSFLSSTSKRYRAEQKIAADSTTQIEGLMADLPEICPVCKKPLDQEDRHE